MIDLAEFMEAIQAKPLCKVCQHRSDSHCATCKTCHLCRKCEALK